jgi:hypothetical protein
MLWEIEVWAHVLTLSGRPWSAVPAPVRVCAYMSVCVYVCVLLCTNDSGCLLSCVQT